MKFLSVKLKMLKKYQINRVDLKFNYKKPRLKICSFYLLQTIRYAFPILNFRSAILIITLKGLLGVSVTELMKFESRNFSITGIVQLFTTDNLIVSPYKAIFNYNINCNRFHFASANNDPRDFVMMFPRGSLA